jgi:hypothetical protein
MYFCLMYSWPSSSECALISFVYVFILVHFSVTLDKVEKNAHDAWAYHRFLFVKEYARNSPLPPPLNTLYYGYECGAWIFRLCKRKRGTSVYLMSERQSS